MILLSDTAPNLLPASASWMLPLWDTIAFISLAAAGVFAGNEIGIFSLSRVRLRLRTAKNEPNALLLADWLQRPTYALEGLLILQNLFSFIFSAAVTAILSIYGFQEFAQGVISILIVTPLVLIFADIMPKDLFHSYADRCM